MNNIKAMYKLSTIAIDTICATIENFLKEIEMPNKERMRICLSAEEMLQVWYKELGEVNCEINIYKYFGRYQIALIADGIQIDPREYEDDSFEEYFVNKNLLSILDVAPMYSYKHHHNQIIFALDKPKKNTIQQTFMAVIMAIILGLVLKNLSNDATTFIANDILSPLSSAYLRLLSAVALPMMFFSVISGIISAGNISSLGKMGKKLMTNCLLLLSIVAGITILINLPFYHFTTDSNNVSIANVFAQIYSMLLEIIPQSFLSPFVTANTLQIICTAIIIGIALLVLAPKVPLIIQSIQQLDSVFYLIMRFISSIIPYFIFVILLNIVISNDVAVFSKTPMIILELIVLYLTLSILVMLPVCLKYRMTPLFLIKKTLPVTMIAFTTASSAASFSANLYNSVHNLGINKKLSDFGIPLYTVMLKAGDCITMCVLTMYMANLYNIAINFNFILVLIMLALILSIATPNVAGGVIVCYSIIYTTLSIPTEALAITATIDIILDFCITATSVFCQQIEIIKVAKKLNMLDETILKSKIIHKPTK